MAFRTAGTVIFPLQWAQRAYRWMRPLWFRMDPEAAHHWNLRLFGWLAERWRPPRFEGIGPVEVGGIRVAHPVGLAAGLDKTGRWAAALARLGFAFVEVGAVTPRPQPGNPRPRLWRFPDHRALVNRMGFNNEGAHATRRHLERHPPPVPVGINVGKNKGTPAEEAAQDYAEVVRTLRGVADFFVINVSSPNTSGLRKLQSVAALDALFEAVDTALGTVQRPLWLKVSPDLSDADLEALARGCERWPVRAVVAVNTTTDLSAVAPPPGVKGGLSGHPLQGKARRIRRRLRALLPAEVDVVASGGMMTPADIAGALAEGAQAVEVLTGLVYYGPALVADAVAALGGKIR